jgi:hypothetical protein
MNNRLQRRVAKAIARKAPVNPVTAIHEAGHAVFAVLFSPPAGWPFPNGALNHIDMYPEPTVLTEAMLKQGGVPVGWTEWSMFPPSMDAYVQPFVQRYANNNVIHVVDLQLAFTEMRAAGFDLDLWLRTKLLMGFAGAAAEAKFTGKSTDDVLMSGACKSDLERNARDCSLCSLSKNDFSAEMTRASILAEQYVEQPEIWTAIKAVAAQLKHGRMSADEVVRIIRRSMPGDSCVPHPIRHHLTRAAGDNA